jgi:hypothetical protein
VVSNWAQARVGTVAMELFVCLLAALEGLDDCAVTPPSDAVALVGYKERGKVGCQLRCIAVALAGGICIYMQLVMTLQSMCLRSAGCSSRVMCLGGVHEMAAFSRSQKRTEGEGAMAEVQRKRSMLQRV